MKISRIQLAECQIPLPQILRLGPIEIKTRDFVVLRVETDSGISGEAIGYPRGTPLLQVLTRMSQKLLGGDVSLRRDLMFKLEQSNVPARAALTRGLSMLDIALWDITCKTANQPLFQLLGGLRKQADTTVVAGYYMDRRSISDIVDEVARLCDAGYRRVKIMLKGDDSTFDREYVSATAEKAPGRVAADAHWTWSTITEARRTCRDLDEFGLNFLEDPFSASDWSLTHELQREMRTPIAAGEDVFGGRAMSDLVRGIGLLRVDATTCGGITGAIEAVNVAAAAGRTVLPHVFAPLHVHFACAFPNVEAVEYIPEDSGADPLSSLLDRLPKIENGAMTPSQEPGVGIHIKWNEAEKLARDVAVVSQKD